MIVQIDSEVMHGWQRLIKDLEAQLQDARDNLQIREATARELRRQLGEMQTMNCALHRQIAELTGAPDAAERGGR